MATSIRVVPIALLMGTRVLVRPLGHSILIRTGAEATALLVVGLAFFLQFKDAASLLRNHREVRDLVTPANYLFSLFRISQDAMAAPPGSRQPIALDAHRLTAVSSSRKPALLVLAIGETVRSANRGLSGYARQTTPEIGQTQ